MLSVLLYVTLGLALVLVLRRPMRHLFGATPAFTLWLLPLLMAALPWLPAPEAHWLSAPGLRVLPAAQTLMAHASVPVSTLHWWWLVWLAGSVLGVLRLAWHYRHIRRDCRHLPAAMRRVLQAQDRRFDPGRYRVHPSGPAVLWAPRRSLIILPSDFLQRFDIDQRRLVLQHEHTHLRRRDGLWSLLAELVVAILWFHPLVWLALPRLRLDQELACDERVLRQSPQQEIQYVHTLLHSTGVIAMPVFIPWLSQSQLKERLIMIKRARPGTMRRRLGFTTLAILMSASVFVVQAATHDQSPAAQTQTQDTRASFIRPMLAPAYPKSAVDNNEQGTVILKILVDKDGSPQKITVDPTSAAPSALVTAAVAAAAKWQFDPATKDGKPVEGWLRIPVKFETNDEGSSAHSATL